MKWLILIMFSFQMMAQDSIRVPQKEIDDIIAVMDTLIIQDSISNEIILQQGILIKSMSSVIKQDSLILSYKNIEVGLLNDRLLLYETELNRSNLWYEQRWFGILLGSIGTIGIIHVVDYSLPK